MSEFFYRLLSFAQQMVENFYSRWRSFRVIANPKREKFGREGILCPRAFFTVIFFSSFFLHQCIHKDHYPRHFSIYHYSLCESLKKWHYSQASAKNADQFKYDF